MGGWRWGGIGAVLCGCTGASDDDTGALRCEPSLTLLSAEVHGQPLQPGDPLTVAHGPQGGWHIDVLGAVSGFVAEVSVAPTVIDLTSGQAIAGDQPEVRVPITQRDRCEGDFAGVRAFIDDVSPAGSFVDFICRLAGRPLRLEVTVASLDDGVSAFASVEGPAARDPVDEAVCRR